ncbi:hypothetical protein SS50377_24407 [Spironucleus salmonicida]|uniref:Uncharacterized protein n=1 Tax=Spironucleus salmonicida TaxID=348837 RepID=V6LP77_9EUKA|nr:hypothetical protein SS50377_24407 [Spironucleus salmonicida]|eukprot:EST46043.1 Hypothetical protein SS50377_14031 [Spironucleus salmonicida]
MTFLDLINTIPKDTLINIIRQRFEISYNTSENLILRVQACIIVQCLSYIDLNEKTILKLAANSLKKPFSDKFSFMHFTAVLQMIFCQDSLMNRFCPSDLHVQLKKFASQLPLLNERTVNISAFQFYNNIKNRFTVNLMEFSGTPHNSLVEISEKF